MYAKYVYNRTASDANDLPLIFDDIIKISTGETNKANLSALCDQNATEILTTYATSNWTIHDDLRPGTQTVVLKSPLSSNPSLFKYVRVSMMSPGFGTDGGVDVPTMPFLYPIGFHEWDNVTHTGTLPYETVYNGAETPSTQNARFFRTVIERVLQTGIMVIVASEYHIGWMGICSLFKGTGFGANASWNRLHFLSLFTEIVNFSVSHRPDIDANLGRMIAVGGIGSANTATYALRVQGGNRLDQFGFLQNSYAVYAYNNEVESGLTPLSLFGSMSPQGLHHYDSQTSRTYPIYPMAWNASHGRALTTRFIGGEFSTLTGIYLYGHVYPTDFDETTVNGVTYVAFNAGYTVNYAPCNGSWCVRKG